MISIFNFNPETCFKT